MTDAPTLGRPIGTTTLRRLAALQSRPELYPCPQRSIVCPVCLKSAWRGARAVYCCPKCKGLAQKARNRET